jgi:hypothetical protein
MRYATAKWCTSVGLACAALLGCGDDDDNTKDNKSEGDGIRGGVLYDKWWAVTEQDEPEGNHPLWASRPDKTSNTVSGPDTWRCKECHGWDYEGVDGAYGSGSHRTGIKGILGTEKSASEIVALLSDPDGHAYGELLNEQALADLATFVTSSTIDTSKFIGSDGSFKGQADAGEESFAICATCHGDDGLNEEPTGSEGGFEDFPGLIANDNPEEFLHKVRFGQPGTAMPPQADLLSDEELAELGSYVQTLPQEP